MFIYQQQDFIELCNDSEFIEFEAASIYNVLQYWKEHHYDFRLADDMTLADVLIRKRL